MAFPPTIHEGASGPTVKWAQYLLTRRTMSDEQIDGQFGPVTKAAVEQFQGYEHLTVDGVVGPVTWGALGGDKPEPPTLQSGSHGSVVHKLQTILNEGQGGFVNFSPPLAEDGAYGPKTAAAVKAAQQFGHIPADGIVGLQTWGLSTGDAGGTLASHCSVTPPGGP